MLYRFWVLAAALVLSCGLAQAYDAPQSQSQSQSQSQAGAADTSQPVRIVEPQLRIAPGGAASPQVALTLDACMGKTDRRILGTLVENRIPATIFVTGRWLRQNAEAFTVMKAHPDLFEIENHGAMHVPAITNVPTMYGIRTAGSLDAVRAEINGGAEAISGATAPKPAWYRDATARYSTDAVKLAESMGYRIGGYSLNGDMGASLLAATTERRIAAARDGDVIISHINQPTRSAGAGVAKGILALKARGMKFVLLKDVETTMTLNPVPAHNLHAGNLQTRAPAAGPKSGQ